MWQERRHAQLGETGQHAQRRFQRGVIADTFVSGVQPFGFFVELRDYFVEGLVHVATLADDDYEFVPRAHLLRARRRPTIYRIGDPVTVRVTAASPERQRIDFQLVTPPSQDVADGRAVPFRRRRRKGP